MPLASEFADEEGNEYLILQFHDKIESIEVTFERAGAEWIISTLNNLSGENQMISFKELRVSFEEDFEDFDYFWESEEMGVLREMGLLVL